MWCWRFRRVPRSGAWSDRSAAAQRCAGADPIGAIVDRRRAARRVCGEGRLDSGVAGPFRTAMCSHLPWLGPAATWTRLLVSFQLLPSAGIKGVDADSKPTQLTETCSILGWQRPSMPGLFSMRAPLDSAQGAAVSWRLDSSPPIESRPNRFYQLSG